SVKHPTSTKTGSDSLSHGESVVTRLSRPGVVPQGLRPVWAQTVTAVTKGEVSTVPPGTRPLDNLNTCSASHLQNYLEVEADVEVADDGVEFFAGVHHTALVTLTEPHNMECLSQAQHMIRQKPLERKVPSLLPIRDPPTSIIICDLDPHLSEDHLFYYFDSPRSGGDEGGVLDNGFQLSSQRDLFKAASARPKASTEACNTVVTTHTAVPVTSSTSQAREILSSELLTPQSPASSDEEFLDCDSGVPEQALIPPERRVPKSDVFETVKKAWQQRESCGLASTQHGTFPNVLSGFECHPDAEVLGHAESPGAADSRGDSAGLDDAESLHDIDVSCAESSENVPSMSDLPPVLKDMGKGPSKVAEDHGDSAGRAECKIRPDKDTLASSHAPSSKQDHSISELMLKFEHLRIENEALKKKKDDMIKVEVPAYQLTLLSDFAKADHGCQVTPCPQEGLVLLHGRQEECEKARCELLLRIQSLVDLSLPVPAPIIKLLKSENGQRYLNSMLQNHPKCAVDLRDTHIIFAAVEASDAQAALEDLKKRIVHKSVEVHPQSVQNAHFLRLQARLEEEHLVCLTLPTAGSSGVVVDGFDGDVDLAMRKLDQTTVLTSQMKRDFTFQVKNGGEVGREDTEGVTMIFKCRQEVMQRAKDELNAIEERIVTASMDLKSEFTSYSDCALVINGLHSSGVEDYCTHLERAFHKDEGLEVMFSITLPQKCSLPELRYGLTKGTKHSNQHRHSGHSRQEWKPWHSHGRHHGGQQHHHGSHDHGRSRYIRPLHATVGNATITVKSGNITREKVDVLVNIVAEDLNMKQTAVGSAIFKRYPQVGQKGQVVAGADQCLVIPTQIPADQQGDNQPSLVLHAVLRKWPANSISANVKSMVQKCLLMATQAGKMSISFPPLGIGRRFKFPEDAIANSMLTSTLEFVQSNPGSMQKVSLVVFDTDLARMFREIMRQKLSLPADTSAIAAAAKPSQCGDDPDNIKDKLMKNLRMTFLHTDTVDDYLTFRRLDGSALGEIKSASAKNNVIITASNQEGKLEVRGEKSGVVEVVALIGRKLLQYKTQQEHAGSELRKRIGLPTDTHRIPSYWEVRRKASKKVDEALRSSKKQSSIIVPVTTTEREAIEKLVMVTWEAGKAGAGKDARGLTHQSIQVVDVRRLENVELWERYSERREKFFRHLELKFRSAFPAVASVLPKGPLKTTQNLPSDSPLLREVYPQVNPKTARTDGSEQLVMILMRTLLGEPHVTSASNPPKFERPPCKNCKRARCTCEGSEQFDSVIDDSERIFREFVVYERCLCYPEYFITYQRV
ncbi:hypothetical protein BaRGS_00019927, partial [Batillaria attramentaria]